MRALSEIRFPKPLADQRSEQERLNNQFLLNKNFKQLSDEIAAIEERLAELEAKDGGQ